jgi:hypothetical protein
LPRDTSERRWRFWYCTRYADTFPLSWQTRCQNSRAPRQATQPPTLPHGRGSIQYTLARAICLWLQHFAFQSRTQSFKRNRKSDIWKYMVEIYVIALNLLFIVWSVILLFIKKKCKFFNLCFERNSPKISNIWSSISIRFF